MPFARSASLCRALLTCAFTQGEDGVRDVMLLLRDEFKSVMELMGMCTKLRSTVHKSCYQFSTFSGCLSIQMLQDGEFIVSRSCC